MVLVTRCVTIILAHMCDGSFYRIRMQLFMSLGAMPARNHLFHFLSYFLLLKMKVICES